ncbi:hypothetical protein OIU77_016585 [Salix suchowensis]|uniref:Uncharacterized protein n=1 Tax=Salix suchowensis TaxID=1278906 RepID=A0ABQ8ZKU1_9ROSI|nr:hypothetical protein OIU77_016585 [Salix suchowensis]
MKEQIGMKNCGQQRLPDCERKRSEAKNQTKRTMGTVMKSKINFLFKTKKDPLEISKNLRKTKHENLSDTSRNSRMKETDKELPRRREKGEDFVKEDIFFLSRVNMEKENNSEFHASFFFFCSGY